MESTIAGQFSVGEYVMLKRIGQGSFSTVWKAKHRVTGLEVAIKEIPTQKLSKKLQESLESEISILENSNHPNIIRLLGKVKGPDKIYLVLEFCAGGDLSDFIRSKGRADEDTARNFMQQLAAGLQILRAHNLIHRDLKPQNLLLTSRGSDTVLKIADFGFARALQPQGLAETLCGSPLYMAPEILQFQKYDAKADLWSVGAILFELLTGRPPYGGQNHVQLIRNIERNEAVIPDKIQAQISKESVAMCLSLLQRNPVQRLSFEEFFCHPFLYPQRTMKIPDKPVQIMKMSHLYQSQGTAVDSIKDMGDLSMIEGLPFALDDITSTVNMDLTFSRTPNSETVSSVAMPMSRGEQQNTVVVSYSSQQSAVTSEVAIKSTVMDKKLDVRDNCGKNLGGMQTGKEDLGSVVENVGDSMEAIEKEYVVVNTPLVISQEHLMLQTSKSIFNWGFGSHMRSEKKTKQEPKALAPPVVADQDFQESAGSRLSSDPSFRVSSLQKCAIHIGAVADQKFEAGLTAESLSLHLLVLATWRKALEVCHSWATSASGVQMSLTPGSSTSASNLIGERGEVLDQAMCASEACSTVEREFMAAVERAEGIGKLFGSQEALDCPEAVEIVFESALSIGRNAAVDELMGNIQGAEAQYLRSSVLFYFLLTEATSLNLNPPFVLLQRDRDRIQRYMDSITFRQLECSTIHQQSVVLSVQAARALHSPMDH